MKKPKRYYDDVSEKYNDKILKNPYETYRFKEITKKIVSFIPRKDGMQVLDVGCGTGEFTFSILPKILKNARLSGVDFSEGMITLCKKRFPRYFFKVMDAQNLHYKDERFDLVLSRQMLEHVPNPLQALREMHRVLKKGGTLVLSTPSWFGLIGPLYAIKKRTGTMQPIDNWWTPFSLKKAFVRAGFQKITFTSVCYVPYHAFLPKSFIPLVKISDKAFGSIGFSKYFGRTLIFKAEK